MTFPWPNSYHGGMRIACALAALIWIGTTDAATDIPVALQEARGVLGDLASTPAARAQATELLEKLILSSESNEIRAEALVGLGASRLFVNVDFPGAIELFEQARSLVPVGSTPWCEATFGLATAIHHRIPVSRLSISQARELFEEILDHDQESQLAARALLNLGRIHEVFDYDSDEQDLPSARAIYQHILKRWPDADIAHEAAYRLGSTYIQEGYHTTPEQRSNYGWRLQRIQTGIDHLEDWVKRHPDHPLAPAFWEYIGNSYLFLPGEHRKPDLALEAYLNATGDAHLLDGSTEAVARKRNMDRVDPGYLYLRIAALAQNANHRFIALEYYCRLIGEEDRYRRGPMAALQLTANLGFTREEVLEHLARQFAQLDQSAAEIEALLEQVEFPEPPVGKPFPTP